MIQPYVTETGISLSSVSALWKILDGAYDDPDKQRTAERELRKLKQANKEFSTYLATFNKWMAVAKWDTTAKRSQLLEGLSEEMQDALQWSEPPEDYDDLVVFLLKQDNRLRARAAARKSRPSAAPAPRPTPRTPTATTATTPAPAAGPSAPRTTTNSGYYGPAPMDLSAQREAARQAKRNERFAGGLCLVCGDPGHFKADCPVKRASDARRAARLAANSAETTTTPPPGPASPSAQPAEN